MTASGTIVQQFELNGGSNQQWMLVPLDDGADVVVNMASGLVLDDPNGSTASGTVAGVSVQNGQIQLTVGSNSIGLSQVLSVSSS